MTEITKESLLEKGWQIDKVLEKFKIEGYQYHTEDYHLNIVEGSNTPNRNWILFIDNHRFESIGSLDVQYFEQINGLLELLDFKAKF